MNARLARALLGLALMASPLGAPVLGAQVPGMPRTPPPQPAPPAAGTVVRNVVQTLGQAAAARERQRATAAYDPIFRKYTKRYFGIATDWRWFKAQGMAESNLVPTARSRVGARGIMQLMPSTYAEIKSKGRGFRAIDDPEWNIAAGIAHDRYLWQLWDDRIREDEDRWSFMFGSYNAGQGTIMRAQRVAAQQRLDQARWQSIEQVAPSVERWRWVETLGYVRRIRANKAVLPER